METEEEGAHQEEDLEVVEVGISSEDPEKPDILVEMGSSKSRSKEELPEQNNEISANLVAKSSTKTGAKIKEI